MEPRRSSSVKSVITGITGFAGSYLAEALVARGDQVLGIARQDRWPPGTPSLLANTVPLLTWDITEPLKPNLESQLSAWQPDCWYHLAAMSVPADCGSQTPTPAAIACNVEGTRHIVELLTRFPHPVKLLFTSSNHVYADVNPEHPLVDENADLDPRSAYGKTKLAAESIIQEAIREHDLDACIARSFQHTGPRQQPRMMVPEWARQFAQPTETIQVQSLDSYLDLSDVRDIVQAYRQLMQANTPQTIFNIGTGNSISGRQVCNYFQQLVPVSRPVHELNPRQHQHPIANTAQLQAATGWKPQIPLRQTITDTFHYWAKLLAPQRDV